MQVWQHARMPAALLCAALGCALAVGAGAGEYVLLVAVVAVQGVLVWGWSRWLDAPHPGGTAVAGAAALAADLMLVVRDVPRPLAAVAGTLGLVPLAAMAHQLVRRDRTRVTTSLSATVAVAVLATSVALYLPAGEGRGHGSLVAVAVLAAAAAGVTAAFGPLVGLAVGVAAGAALGVGLGLGTDLGVGAGVVVGVAAGGLAAAAGAAVQRSGRESALVRASLPFAMVAPVTYVLGRILAG